MAENPQLTALKSERDALMGMTDPASVARLREVNALISSIQFGGGEGGMRLVEGGGEVGEWGENPFGEAPPAGSGDVEFGENIEDVLAGQMTTVPLGTATTPLDVVEPTEPLVSQAPAPVIPEGVTPEWGDRPTPSMERPWWVPERTWERAGTPEAQATIAQTGQQMILPIAATVAQIGFGWGKTAAEKATEEIRKEYKPGAAGAEAVARYQQAVGSTSGAAMKLMKDTMHTLFAAQGQTGAASYTQAAREAKRVGLAGKAQEEATEARIYEGAEAGAKQDYMQALATPTAWERRVGQLSQVFSGEGVLAESLGAVAGAKALVVAAPALAKMTPEQRLVWTKAIKENPALAYELMARHGEGTTATTPAETPDELPA